MAHIEHWWQRVAIGGVLALLAPLAGCNDAGGGVSIPTVTLPWSDPVQNGQLVAENLLGAPLVSDDGQKIVYQTADSNFHSLFPSEPADSAPGVAYYADTGEKKLIAFPAQYFPIEPSDDFSQFVFGRFSKSGLTIYLFDPVNGTSRELVKGASITAHYDLAGNKLVYVTGEADYKINEGGTITVYVDSSGDHEVHVLDLKTGARRNISNSPRRYDSSCRISENGKVVYDSSGDDDSDIFYADLEGGASPAAITGSEGYEFGPTIDTQGKSLTYWSWIGPSPSAMNVSYAINVYDVTTRRSILTLAPGDYRAAEISPRGDKLAVIESEMTEPRIEGDWVRPQSEDRFKIVDISSGEAEVLPGNIRYATGQPGTWLTGVRYVTFSPNGKYVAWAAEATQVRRNVLAGVTDTGPRYKMAQAPVYKGFIKEIE